MSDRIAVTKTYKLFINGAFPRSESGRTVEVVTSRHGTVANIALASRKDVRDAVVAARAAANKWAEATAYNRGQVLYRVAELLEARRSEFVALVSDAEDLSTKKATAQVDEGIDTMVWFAGWTDKLAQVLGSANPVAGPFFNFSIPKPTGVIAIVTPTSNFFSGLAASVAAPLAAGNVVLALTGNRAAAATMITFGEVLATSDVPAGVVNLLTGDVSELGNTLAQHEDIDGLDLAGAGSATAALSAEAASTIKRVVDNAMPGRDTLRLRAFTETATVWHTKGF
jgi:acyl-CoA reductase-like NAD-dependent aldehyde dehydrogenase